MPLDPFATWIISWTFTTKQSAWNFTVDSKEATNENRCSLFPPTNGPSLTVVVSHKLCVIFAMQQKSGVQKKTGKILKSNGWSKKQSLPMYFFAELCKKTLGDICPKHNWISGYLAIFPLEPRPGEPWCDRSCHLPFCITALPPTYPPKNHWWSAHQLPCSSKFPLQPAVLIYGRSSKHIMFGAYIVYRFRIFIIIIPKTFRNYPDPQLFIHILAHTWQIVCCFMICSDNIQSL